MAAPQSKIIQYATHLEGWIQSCNENHGDKCQVDPIAERPPHHIPDWVIDTEDGCIVRGCSVERYVALSYVWDSAAKDDVGGGRVVANDRLLLQNDNLDDFCRPGFLRSHILGRVPAVIRDAIDFVQLSGSRYLWVDSLCIVQHEDSTRDRIGLMNEIYSGAYFTIIAAASTEGLYGGKDHDDGELPRKNTTVRMLHSKLLCSHWASRGWTFQEQLLSKRSIVFLDDVCFWDCGREVKWPWMEHEHPLSYEQHLHLHVWLPPSSSRHPYEDGALNRVVGKRIDNKRYQDLASLSPVPDFKFYVELICRYGNRDLTYDQDVLPAFSGVLEVLSRRSFHGGFICGLPALFLDSALLWQPLLKARRRSPVGTATKIAPVAPLPSWSWVGWQCLVDPDSLRGGLDYVATPYSTVRAGEASWRTWKLVDWSTISDDRSANPVDEPALLQSFKAAWKEPNGKSLPTDWSHSRRLAGALVHESNPFVNYSYPLPTQNTCSATIADRNTPLLSCTTRIASLRVRRVLVPYDIDTAEWKRLRPQEQSMAHASVFETDLYNFKPQIHVLCPVVTLEDGKGRWAGAMAIMESEASVKSGSEIKMIAISTGSALHKDVAESYPERIDSQGYWCYEPMLEDYHFRPLDWRDGLDNAGGKRKFSAADDTQSSVDAGIDVGPFASHSCQKRRHSSSIRDWKDAMIQKYRNKIGPAVGPTPPAAPNPPERYHFYNVLWVETIDGVMYRKAAGRVPKEIWELNCGEPTKIVLG